MEIRPTPEQFAILLQRYIENRYSAKDVDQLLELIDDPAYHGLALEMIQGKMEQLSKETIQQDEALARRLNERLETIFDKPRSKRSIPMITRWVAAAVFLIIAGAGAFFLLKQNKTTDTTIVATTPVAAPDKNRATITLGDGRTVYLDGEGNGQLANIGGVSLRKLADGQIAYEGVTSLNRMPDFNTVSNPRGSRVIDLTLADGSHVWLNAGSSIRFPVAFVQPTRNVELDGEAYFEVAGDKSHPFIVQKGASSVTVLGTHFNVKAYTNEPNIKVTLLEGSVKVNHETKEQLLAPGQQAVLTDNIQLIKDADTKEALAWKNGYTSFHGAGFQAVLNEIQRWYDIDVDMKANASAFSEISFYLDMKRSAPLEDVLGNVLTDNKIRFTLDGKTKKLTILP